MSSVARWAVLFMVSVAASGQEAPSGARFDVISIRQNVSGAVNEGTPPLQHGRLRFTNVTVQGIMSLAFYPIDFAHIKGAPGWTAIGRSGSHYDIEAIAEARVITEERYHQMLQTMLADRFGLKFHWESHQEPVYLLVADKKGLKLKATDPSSCVPVPPETSLTPNGTACGRQYTFTSSGSEGGLHFEGIGMTMKTLAVVLGLSGRPVFDRTGYEAMVDVKLDFTPANRLSTDVADGPPSIFAALPEQLGLRLQPATGPVETMVIDHVERPSED
ncbi:MAG TPA: TIGR03435 family protein [Bryobacteraceae bacterium]|nr:TIGR03435 family protein [Bryobacteraceae bacterium]